MKRVRKLTGGDLTYMIFCPACNEHHGFDKRWTFNDNFEYPTFRPSLVTGDSIGKRCHSFVTEGHIEYLSDCHHGMAGKIVDLPDVEAV